MKRMIVRHDGFKVFPSHVEQTVCKCEAVEACCVVEIADEAHSQGKIPAVFVVLTANADERIEQQAIQRRCESDLPEYAQPVSLTIIERLPVTPIGKIDYRALEALAGEETPREL